MARFDSTFAADLWFFRVAADAGTFVLAGKRLAVTQSAVTQRIKRLEARLDVQLFERKNGGLVLTPVGQILFKDIKTGYDKISSALEKVGGGGASHPLTVNCAPSFGLGWLTSRLPKFYASYPERNVTLLVDMYNVDQSSLEKEFVDVSVFYGPEPPADAPVVFDQPEPLFPVTSPQYKEKKSREESAESVTLLHDLAAWRNSRFKEAEWSLWLNKHGSPWDKETQNSYFNLAYLSYQAAINHEGVAMGRSLLVDSHIRSGRLVSAVDAQPLQGMRYYISARSYGLDTRVDEFVNWLNLEMSMSRRAA